MAAPPTVPSKPPPVNIAPAAAPTPAPIAVFLSRVVMLLHPVIPNTNSNKVTLNIDLCIVFIATPLFKLLVIVNQE
jgi:hypothetical protein